MGIISDYATAIDEPEDEKKEVPGGETLAGFYQLWVQFCGKTADVSLQSNKYEKWRQYKVMPHFESELQ